MTFLDRQQAAKADRERKERLWGKPQATVLKFSGNCVSLPVASEAPHSSTSAELTEKPAEAVAVPIAGPAVDSTVDKLLVLQRDVRDIEARVSALLSQCEQESEGEETVYRPLTRDIVRAVGKYYNISPTDILSFRRPAEVVKPRQIAMYLARILTLSSLPEIGRRLGKRDHTTVLHAVRKIALERVQNQELDSELSELTTMLEKPNGL